MTKKREVSPNLAQNHSRRGIFRQHSVLSDKLLETVFPQVVAAMKENEFTSHEFILQLAHDHQAVYVKALAVYADTDRPFQIVHGEIAKRLRKHKNLVVKTGETTSYDIFGQKESSSTWRKVK